MPSEYLPVPGSPEGTAAGWVDLQGGPAAELCGLTPSLPSLQPQVSQLTLLQGVGAASFKEPVKRGRGMPSVDHEGVLACVCVCVLSLYLCASVCMFPVS